MLLLAVFAPSILTGCVKNTPGNVTGDDLDAVLARVEQLETDNAALEERVAALEAAFATLSDDVVRVIGDTTVTVGSGEELETALSDLDHYRIASGATYTIYLNPGTYSFTHTLVIQHPDGARIRIEGDATAPASVVLDWSGSTDADGILVTDNQSLGYVGGVKFSGCAWGLHVLNGGFVALGPAIVETSGPLVEWGAIVVADEDVIAAGYPAGWLDISRGGYGLDLWYGAVAYLNGVEIQGSSHPLTVASSVLRADNASVHDNPGWGAAVANGGSAYLDGAVIENNSYGISVSGNGTASVNYASVRDSSDGPGILATKSSVVYGDDDTTVSGNAGYGVDVQWGSVIEGAITISGNDVGGLGVFYGSVANVGDAAIEGNTSYGIDLEYNSMASLFGGHVNNTVGYGVTAQYDSVLYGGGATFSGNTLGDVAGSTPAYSAGSTYAYSTSTIFN